MHPEDPKPSSIPPFPLPKVKSFLDLDFDSLKETHELFIEPWGGKDKGLTKKQFCDVIKKTIGSQFTDKDLEALFAKTNANCSKMICWKDFIGCLTTVLQYHGFMEGTALKIPIFQPEVKFIHNMHRHPIVAICFVPILRLQSVTVDYSKGRYYMLGRDGLISMWTLNIRLLCYHWIGSTRRGNLPRHYIDMKVLYPLPLIVVISAERCITIWEINSTGVALKYTIMGLSNFPTCLDYWVDLTSRSRNMLLWGDTAGDVHCLELNVSSKDGLFIKHETKESLARIHYHDLLRGKISGVRLKKVAAIHNGWVIKVSYLPMWDAIISCSQTNIKSLFYGDFHGKREYYSCRTSVLCFEYSVLLNILVTGCLNNTVCVWNFFVRQTPIFTLRGHVSPVIAVAIRDATQHVISVDTGHVVSVYSLLDQQCIQRFSRVSMAALGGLPTTGHFYNAARNELTMASTIIAWVVPDPAYNVHSDRSEICSHAYPLVGVIYSSEFCKVVSACRGGFITVWDIYTGTPTLQFRHFSPRTPQKEVTDESEYNKVEITAFAMDQTGRRIVTGATDGTINLWNYSGGILIKHYSLPETVVVTAIVSNKELIFVTGWQKRVYIINTEAKKSEDSLELLRCMHMEDILCMTLVHPGLLATASYDGDIILVKFDTGNMTCKLNACLSRYPIKGDDRAKLKGPDKSKEEEEVDEPCADIFDVLTGRYVTREESDAQTKSFENSVDAMLFLPTRQPNDERTATLITAGNEGWIRAWSLHNKGGLLGQFAATEGLGEMVYAMTTDPQNEFLITGDTQGYVRVWDLLLYCNRAAELISETKLEARDDAFQKKFFFLRSPILKDKTAEGHYNPHKRPPPMASKPEFTLKIPRLLNVFRAHAFPITCITYVADRELIITGDLGKTVRIWLLNGRYIGTCGEPWHGLISPKRKMVQLRHLPSELRRCLSARTFKVLQGGAKHPLWETALFLVRQHLRAKRRVRQYEEKEKLARKEKKEEEKRLTEGLGREWSDPRKSSILGSTYKPNLHCRSRPRVSLGDANKEMNMFPVYHTLPIHDLDDVKRISQASFPHKSERRKHISMIPVLMKARRFIRKSRAMIFYKKQNMKLPPINLEKHRVSPSTSDKVLEVGSHSGTSVHLPLIDNRNDDGQGFRQCARTPLAGAKRAKRAKRPATYLP